MNHRPDRELMFLGRGNHRLELDPCNSAPWEFDPEQPRYPAPWSKRFRHYLNLSRSLPRLERLLARFRFGTLREVLEAQGYARHFDGSGRE